MASGGPAIRSLGRTLGLGSYLSRALGVASPRSVGFQDTIGWGKVENLRSALENGQAFSTEAARGIVAGVNAKDVWPLKSSIQSLGFYSSLSAVEEQAEGEGGSVQENVVEPQAEPAPVRERQEEQEINLDEPQSIGSKEELINTAGRSHFDVLLENMRAWPVDVDLNKKLKDGNLGGRPLRETTVAGVLNVLSMEHSSHDESVPLERQMSEDTDSEGGEVAAAKPASEMEYDIGNAHRAVNLVNWWRNQHPDQPFDLLVTPLLFCLAKANLLDEISAFANDYAVEFRKHSLIAAALIKVYCTTGLFGAVVDVYHKARENSVFLGAADIPRVLQALAALGSPAEELLAVYRDTEHKRGLPTSSFEAMLGAGVAIDDLHVPNDESTKQLEFRLIAALTSLGRLDEAKAFVKRTFLSQPEQLDMTLIKLIATLTVLERCGLIEEAEQLAELQRSEKQVNIPGALHFAMKNARDIKKAAQSYESVMRLKGEHQENFILHVGAVAIFSKLRDADRTWQAYQRAKEIRDTKPAGAYQVIGPTYKDIIMTMARKGRVAEAELALADYYESWANGKVDRMVEFDRTLDRLTSIYLSEGRPEMIVQLAQDMVDNRLWVRQGTMQTWCEKLKDRDMIAELRAIQAKMKSYREATYKETWQRNGYSSKQSMESKNETEIEVEGN